MSFLGRLFLILLCSLGVVLAQETPSPTPAPAPVAEASPTPATLAAEPTPPAGETTPPTTTPSPASASDLPPAPTDASPTPSPSPSDSPTPTPSPSPDVIPLDGQAAPDASPAASPAEGATASETPPASGAPLDTENLAPALPEPATDKAMPDAAFTDPNAIIPDQPPKPPGLPQNAENAHETERKLDVRYHEVRVQAEKDEQVARMLARSAKATTDEDYRAAMREYYRLLFKKIVSIDKSLDDKCQKMEAAYLRRLAQQRMEPTIPLNPPPTPEPLN